MRRIKPLLTVLGVLVFFFMLGTVFGEDVIPPTPEPPASSGPERPTPGPTEPPEKAVIDHINYPREQRDFRFRQDAKLLEIWFPSIRDADEAILTYDGQVYLIDCGDEKAGGHGADLLKQLGITKIDILFTSHLHHDHINGLAVTDDTAKSGMIKTCYPLDSTESGLMLRETADLRGIPISEYRNGDTFYMGSDGAVSLQFFKNSNPELDMNNQGAVTIVRYGERSILFAADLDKAGQEELLKHVDPSILKSDILKYPHHAKNALAEGFYEAVRPRLAVVTTVQKRKDLGHRYLIFRKIPSAFTPQKGLCIHLATDGNFWLCENVKTKEQ